MKPAIPAALVLVGCGEIPSTPSFQQDVQPIFAANCARCHGHPALPGVKTTFRLTYSTNERAKGASDPGDPNAMPPRPPMWTTIDARVSAREMPPRLELTDDQIEIIARWSEQGGQRGEPRPGNRAPRARVVDVVGATVIIDVHDPDGDLVGGVLLDTNSVMGELHQGRNYVEFPAIAGTFTLSAELDDGGAIFPVDIGTVRVEP